MHCNENCTESTKEDSGKCPCAICATLLSNSLVLSSKVLSVHNAIERYIWASGKEIVPLKKTKFCLISCAK